MNSSENMISGIFALLMTVPVLLLRGLVIVKIWTWFLVGLGAPIINIPQGLGIGILCNYILSAKQEKYDGGPFAQLITHLLVTLFVLLFAYTVKQFL